ncbi:MAG: transposase [Bacteroidota bacterium]
MRRYELIDVQWNQIKDLIPTSESNRGRLAKSHRLMFSGILWVLFSGAVWRDLPDRFGPWKTVYDRFLCRQEHDSFDRILATQFGVKAFEMVLDKKFGRMASFQHNTIVDVSLTDATSSYNHISQDSYLLQTARGMGICLGD